MATLEELWADRDGKDITQVCKRAGKPGIYIAFGHKTRLRAAQAARSKQAAMNQNDIDADDWYLAPGP